MKRLFFIIAIGLVSLPMLLLTGCNTTQLISSWKAPNASLRSYNKILVIGLMDAKERGLREEIENKLVASFVEHGISAGSSLSEYGLKLLKG